MKIKFKGKKGTIKLQGDEGRRLAEHVQNGGSLGDIMIPTLSPNIKTIEAEVSLKLDETRGNDNVRD